MGNFQIQHGLPIPEMGRKPKYPWREMGIGDSFLVACGGAERIKCMNSLTSCMNRAGRKTGHKYCQRVVLYGIRVWRTK